MYLNRSGKSCIDGTAVNNQQVAMVRNLIWPLCLNGAKILGCEINLIVSFSLFFFFSGDLYLVLHHHLSEKR